MPHHGFLATILALSLTVAASPTAAWAQQTAPPGGKFQKVSALVALPDFLPGMGTLYVDPATIPAGPFLAYDRDGKLVSSLYMIPLKDDLHSLRIPERAEPWDSGFLVNPGSHFEVTLTVPGVYDYFCAPHEAAGMVGRIVVGRPVGPGGLPFDYFKGRPGTGGWKLVPRAAQEAFPSVNDIMRRRVIKNNGEGG